MIDISYEKQGSYLQGKREGKEEGREEGKAEGRKEGLEKGRKEGAKETKLDIAKAMLTANEPISKICAYTGMNENDIIKLKNI